MSERKLLKNVLAGVLIFVAAFAGVYFGMTARGGFSSTEGGESMPEPMLKTGVMFPNVPLLSEDNVGYPSRDLVAGQGCVVIFMEFGCPPCELMAENWQKLIDEKQLAPNLIAGVTIAEPDHAHSYRLKHKLAFPIYCDTAGIFMNQHGVEQYPLCLVVGKSGTVRYYTFDSRQALDPAELRILLNQ